MTGEQINKFLEQVPEMDSISEVANYLISNLRGVEGVSFFDIAILFIEYTRDRKDLHAQIDYITIPEEFLRKQVILVNDIITGIYVDNKRVFKYQCPSCKAIHEIEVSDEEYNRFLDLYFCPGIEDGYKDMEVDDILWDKYREQECEQCGASYDIYPNISINGVYAV